MRDGKDIYVRLAMGLKNIYIMQFANMVKISFQWKLLNG